MYNSNSFNVCPHCGKPNSLNARYCSSCGKQLASPEDVIVCHKCHRPNPPMASFCGNCGAPLRTGAQTKICPKCNKEVDINDNVCGGCGYTFGTTKYATPDSSGKKGKAVSVAGPDPRNKGGRAFAIVGLILLLVFAYFMVVPTCVIRPQSLSKLDKGILNNADGKSFYVYDLIYTTISGIVKNGFKNTVNTLGIGGFALAIISAIVALTMVVQLIIYIVRIATNKRAKHMSFFHLVMAIITTLWIALLVMSAKVFKSAKMISFFVPKDFGTGWILFAIPVFFWIFFLFSLIAKQKKLREKAA